MDILANRRAFVALELGNRADIQQLGAQGAPSRVDNWLWQSYLNLAMSYKFSESENTSTDQWQTGSDSINYPTTARAVLNVAFFRHVDGTAIRVWWKDISYLRRYPTTNPGGTQNVGPPSIIATFGQQIFVRPLCDSQLYDVTIDFWEKPLQNAGQPAPAPFAYNPTGSADIGGTLFKVPDDWLEVIDYGAKLRGHADLGEPDRANAIQQLLYGFTVPTTNKFVPGLIAQMWTRRQAEAPGMDYGMQPSSKKRDYTSVG